MAKITITAPALIKKGVMKDETTRTKVLAVVGKNDKLLRELEIHQFGLHRVAPIGNYGNCVVSVETDKTHGQVQVDVISVDTVELLGTATFGYVSFFKCVADEASDLDD